MLSVIKLSVIMMNVVVLGVVMLNVVILSVVTPTKFAALEVVTSLHLFFKFFFFFFFEKKNVFWEIENWNCLKNKLVRMSNNKLDTFKPQKVLKKSF